MRHVTREELSINEDAPALCRLKASAHARVYPSRTGLAFASSSSRLQPSPARPFPVPLLEELYTMKGRARPLRTGWAYSSLPESPLPADGEETRRLVDSPDGRAWIGQVREQGRG